MHLIIDSDKNIVLSQLLEYSNKKASNFNDPGIGGMEYYNRDEGSDRG